MPEYYFPDFPNVAVVILTMLFVFAFFLIATLIVMLLIRGVGRRNKDNRAPRLTIRARVTAKRTDVSGVRRASTTYYTTFQADDGQRVEFQIDGGEYGLLAEGDEGQLSFQGTHYLGFEREAR